MVSDNIVLSVFKNLNILQDEYELREEVYKSTSAYVKMICSFINPEGAKKVFQDDDDRAVDSAPSGPKPLSEYPESVQRSIKRKKEYQESHPKEFEVLDVVQPGDLNIAEYPDE